MAQTRTVGAAGNATDSTARQSAGHTSECEARRVHRLSAAGVDGVAKRAYQKFIARGSRPGCELDDWLAAEHELGTNMRADVSESDEYVHALVSLKGERSAEVSVAVEGRWLMVLDAQEFACQGAPRAMLSAMEWNSECGRADVAPDWSGGPTFSAWRTTGCEIDSEEDEEREALRLRWGSPPFCMVELPAEVDRSRSVCVLADGVLALRMGKAVATA